MEKGESEKDRGREGTLQKEQTPTLQLTHCDLSSPQETGAGKVWNCSQCIANGACPQHVGPI